MNLTKLIASGLSQQIHRRYLSKAYVLQIFTHNLVFRNTIKIQWRLYEFDKGIVLSEFIKLDIHRLQAGGHLVS